MEKQVKCPQCKTLTVYSDKNLFRPFCSERCKMLDFGDWASGKYAVPGEKITIPDKSLEQNNEDDDGEL